MLVWVVLWKLDVPYLGGVYREITLIPFATGQDGGDKSPFEFVVNFVLFVPFGAYLGFFAQSWQWWKVTGVIAAASLALESAQYALSVGTPTSPTSPSIQPGAWPDSACSLWPARDSATGTSSS